MQQQNLNLHPRQQRAGRTLQNTDSDIQDEREVPSTHGQSQRENDDTENECKNKFDEKNYTYF